MSPHRTNAINVWSSLLGLAMVAVVLLYMVGPPIGATTAASVGERLSPANLRADERIEIDFTRSGCRSYEHWLFTVYGGEQSRVAVVAVRDFGDDTEPKYRPVGSITLTPAQRKGLAERLEAYRHDELRELSTTQNRLRISYFAGNVKIGEEAMLDGGRVDDLIYRRDAEIEYSGQYEYDPAITPEMIALPGLYRMVLKENRKAEDS